MKFQTFLCFLGMSVTCLMMLHDICSDSVKITKKPCRVISKFRNIERVRDVLNPMKNASIGSPLSGYIVKLIQLHNL